MSQISTDLLYISKTLLMPNFYYKSIESISLYALQKKGVSTLLIDIDNTLIPYSQSKVNVPKQHWVEHAIQAGFQVQLVSNNSHRHRVQKVAEQLNVSGIYFACKPFPFSTQCHMQRSGIDPEKTAIIGDQLFKDVLMGNWLGMTTVLVNAIQPSQTFLGTWQRDIELIILQKLGTVSLS